MSDSPNGKRQAIELDVDPFGPRPDEFLTSALHGTGLDPVPASTKMFGFWRFEYDFVRTEDWVAARPRIAENIKALYQAGCIRYGSWGE